MPSTSAELPQCWFTSNRGLLCLIDIVGSQRATPRTLSPLALTHRDLAYRHRHPWCDALAAFVQNDQVQHGHIHQGLGILWATRRASRHCNDVDVDRVDMAPFFDLSLDLALALRIS